MNTTSRRSGFTLVEILIVLGIIVLVAGIFVPIVLNLTERNQVPKAASLLENALSLAKSRAIGEKRPNGIRLIASPANLRTTTGGSAFAWYDEIQYIEDPSDYVEHWVWGLASTTPQAVIQPFWARNSPAPVINGPAAPSPGVPPVGVDTVGVAAGPFTFNAVVDSGGATQSVTVDKPQCLFGPISAIVGANTWTSNSGAVYRGQRLQFNPAGQSPMLVQPGDKIEIFGVGELYSVVAVSQTNVDISLAPSARIIVPIYVLDRPLSGNVSVPMNGRPNYRVIRQPRTIPALTPVKLPQDVVIDLTPSRQAFLGNPNGDYDTSNTIFMSNVSTGINMSQIVGLTVAAGNRSIAPDYVDIMFAPSGEVISTSQIFRVGVNSGSFSVGQSGLIALWVHQRGDPNLWAARQITAAQGNADNQALVSINARTGFIGSFPLNTNGGDPLAFVRTGKGRLSADTGP